ncbi:helix-turn-helix transcriptional regulator [Photobacterium piscicola]|nr:helix-turn-helix transcriptional regulator [Photobacterium piscicola]
MLKKQLNYSQMDLSEFFGKSKSTISRWLKG